MPPDNRKPILQYGSLAAWPYWLAEALNALRAAIDADLADWSQRFRAA